MSYEDVERNLRERLQRNMAAAMLMVKGEVQKKINRGNPTGLDPSLPGEPPKKVTGRLFQSIAHRVTATKTSVVGVVGTNVEYAPRLERGFVGTDAAGRNVSQAPRPFLRPALAENVKSVIKLLGRS